jgi:SAM-dependent methyltransferase
MSGIGMNDRCIVCQSDNVDPFLEINQVPVFCNVISPTRVGALSIPRGDINLASCSECGHIFNLDFNAELMDYHQEYENSLHFSAEFNQYADVIASDLVERFGLRGADVLDIGCGDGEFLKLVCKLGENRGVGLDPSYKPGFGKSSPTQELGDIYIIGDAYSDQYNHVKADFIVCRHVLEHLENPAELLFRISSALKNKSKSGAYFEVPNMEYIVEDLSIWDIIYEHCSYFSRASLSRLVESCGFKSQKLNLGFGNQYICLDVTGASAESEYPREVKHPFPQDLNAFARDYKSKVDWWRRKIQALQSYDARIVIWGAGSKGVTFSNMIGLDAKVQYIVDINPRKQGNFIPGTGQRIVSPKFLQEYCPDTVILMNPVYKDEVVESIRRLGISTDVLVA